MFHQDIGAGKTINFTLPVGVTTLCVYLQGAGGGGGGGGPNAGGGGPNAGGGGGGSGAAGKFVFTGSALGGMVINIKTGLGGAGGAGSGGGGVGGANGQHSTVTFPNGFQLIAGGAEGGIGSVPPVGFASGQGRRGGNIATNTPDQGGTATVPAGITFHQFNLHSNFGSAAIGPFGGWGGRDGDCGGGGKGGDAQQSGGIGQGGYCHIECE